MFRILSLLVLLSISLSGYSQCFQKPVSLQERVLESEIVAEGRMDSSYCTWNSDHTLILTVSRFTVFKYFKGFSGNSVNVVTLGGVIDDQMMVAEPEVHLEKSAKGILFLKKNRTGAYEPVAAEQGFIEYDLITKSAAGPFDVYSNISSELYPLLVNLIGKNYTEVEPFNVNAKTLYRITATPTITSFSPTTVTSGTSTVLTINGTNFGASFSGSANIQFKNADNGGATYLASILASNIVSWSDVQIQVKVPYGAGSGQITVTNPTAESVVSAGTLTITYAQINVTSSNVQYEPNLINFNGLGGHTYLYSTATANNGVSFDGHANAKTRFASALGNWNCNTGFNVLVGAGNTAVGTPANDGVNVVMFDNDAAPLPSGVLGRATSWYSGCSGATNWFVSDIDIVFKRDGTDGTTWYFGSNAAAQPGGTSDFESVALHELGHNHQLGHVISLGAVMHYAITTGSNNRTLSPSKDIAGGLYVMGHSNTYTGCGKTGMTSFSCTNPPIANFSGTPTSFCNAPATANFTDLSTNAPTSWSWTFTGGTPATSTSQNPSGIVYNSTGSYTVSLTATNANGSNTMTKTAYITVGGTAVPLSETFEGAFLPTGYSIANADGFTTWQQTGSITGRSGSTTKAAFMDAYNYNFNLGTTDDLITNKYDLNGVNAPKLQFDLAYARYDAGDFDHLQVLVSTDCGSTFPTIVYDKSGSDASGNTLSTRAETTSPFSPTLASEWRLETVDLSAFTGSTVVIKFRFFNGFGNDLFIDNINVSGTPLPVLLESFNAAKAGSTVSLSWKTTVTDKSEVYSIERSSDGINFTEILSMNSISGKNSYQVYDQNALAGMNYYRLKQADENKLFNYSEVVAVDMSPSLNSTMILFPNPVNTGEIFQFEIQGDSNGDLKVFDLSGKPVNVSFERKGSFIEVSVNLNAGVYMVQYSSEGIVRNGKILVK